ncbi:MAG: hypothetical protein V4495_00885 [Pseudomonadota bacterium]
MYPWLWVWSPQVHFPWSGSVAQSIEPNTTWFYNMIPPVSGDAGIEAQVFQLASYGTQLGQITDVLLDIVKETENLSPKALESLKELQTLKTKIEVIKKRSAQPATLE